MINNIRINGIHTNVTEGTQKYVQRKIGSLIKFIPTSLHESTHMDVRLKETNSKNKQCFECDVIIKLPHSTVVVHRHSTSLTTAIDEAEANLKNQLKHYKNQYHSAHLRRHLIGRFKGEVQPDIQLA